ARHAERIVTLSGPRFDCESRAAPVQAGEFRPAHARARRGLRRDPIEVMTHRHRDVGNVADTLHRACHVVRARHEALDQIGGHPGSRTLRMRGDVGVRGGARLRIGTAAAEYLPHAREHRFARRSVGVDRGHAPALAALRTNASKRSMPRAIASSEAAYEKRMCWPSFGTRRPKWMAASTATPASARSRLRNCSESAHPVIAQASVTFGHT